MSLDVFQAVVKGYSDRLFDLQLLSVHTGHWAGYFNRSKRPKSLKNILKTVLNSRKKAPKSPHSSSVDVDAFLEQERMFNLRKAQGEVR